jgi:lipid-A-disaccharide synthase
VSILERLFIITGDHSGDLHAATVVTALKQRCPQVQVIAVGGDALREAGAELFSNQERMGKMGAGSVLSAPEHYFLGRRILRFVKNYHPQAVLLVDYGMFNLWMAKHLKKLGVPVYYFIPPQIWASRRGRIRQIQAFVDHVFCIFPFEKSLYESHGVPVTYVGHPLVGALPPATNREAFCQAHGLDPTRLIVGIFPGSRRSELRALLLRILKALPLLQQKRPATMPPLQFVLAKASSFASDFFEAQMQQALAGLSKTEQSEITIVSGQNHALMSVADVLIAKSGTTTLEAALYKTRMILIYRISPWVYPIALKIAYLPCLGLPNILTNMQTPPVPELWQDAVNPQAICQALLPLLDPKSQESQVQQAAFAKIEGLLDVGQAAENVAEGLLRLVSEHPG